MKRSKTMMWAAFAAWMLAAGIAAAEAASSTSFGLEAWTISSGGTSTSQSFRVSGAVGQTDAHDAATSTSFSLPGGFYACVVATPSPTVLESFELTVSNGLVVVSWTSVTEDDCAGYRIYRDVEGAWTQVQGLVTATGSGSVYHLIDSGAAEGGSYTYRVVSVDSGGDDDIIGEYTREPFALRIQTPAEISSETIVIQWLSRSNKTYRVLAATEVDGTYLQLTNAPATPPQNVHTQQVDGLPTRFFRIEEY